MKTVKLNAVVPEETRKEIRQLAVQQDSTVQAVAALAIDTGMRAIQKMGKKALSELLQPDGRRRQN